MVSTPVKGDRSKESWGELALLVTRGPGHDPPFTAGPA